MGKKNGIIISAIVAVFLIGGGVLAYNNNQNDKKEQEKMAMEKQAGESMEKKDGEAMSKDGSMENDTAMTKNGGYITLAEYNADPAKYADSKKVYFFHASWCPICQKIDKDIKADSSKIPAGTTIIKTDFDNSSDLRQKYGVTTQYTFVQVDANGSETAQWSATSVNDAVGDIKS